MKSPRIKAQRAQACRAVIACALGLSACGGGGGAENDPAVASASPGPVQLKAVAAFPALTFSTPTFMTHAGDGSNRLFVTAIDGVVAVLPNRSDALASKPFLDLRARTESRVGETGLLGLAFDPGFADNGFFYVGWTPTGTTRKFRVSRFKVSATDPDAADPSSERVVVEFEHSAAFHLGGWMGFGADGLLYVSTGDGVQDGAPQDRNGLLGKVLRMGIAADGSAVVPSDNPFGNLVWAYGFRNPWRCGFDRVTGNLWCGDVGNASREEVDVVVKGGNYGWQYYEGTLRIESAGTPTTTDFVAPVHEYDHSVGSAIIGGFVYRGRAQPALGGRYLFTDLSAMKLWTIGIDAAGRPTSASEAGALPDVFFSFGEDEAGEIYGLARGGQVYRLEVTGTP